MCDASAVLSRPGATMNHLNTSILSHVAPRLMQKQSWAVLRWESASSIIEASHVWFKHVHITSTVHNEKCVCVYVRVYVWVYVCVCMLCYVMLCYVMLCYVSMYVCMYVCMYVRVSVYLTCDIEIHTHVKI